MPATGRPTAIWDLRSEHSGAFLRLQRTLTGRQSFTLCFLTYSDSFYRDKVAGFLEARLRARVRVSIDPETRIGTDCLFEKLGADRHGGPAQLVGLERWPEGLDDLLTRLNHRREALAERCPRPLLVWVRSGDLHSVATRAADLWAWRSGVFDFVLPADTDRRDLRHTRVDRATARAPHRLARIEELKQYLAARSSWRPIDADLSIELGDLQHSLGDIAQAEAAYLHARDALADTGDRRRIAVAEGRIADILQDRGELDEALRIRTEEQLLVFERLGDVRLRAITQGQIADILTSRGELGEALRIWTDEVLPVLEDLGDRTSAAIARERIAGIRLLNGRIALR